MDVETLLRGFLLGYFALLAALYSAKTTSIRRRNDPHGALGPRWPLARRMAAKLARIGALAVVALHAAAPSLDWVFVPIPALEHDAIGVAGAAVMLFGGWIVIYSHDYMGVLWRSGVPNDDEFEATPAALIQTGPFARTRNPIFLGVITVQFGLFLVWPCLLTALILLGGAYGLRVQVLREEAALSAWFGPSYAAYAARTPRWI